MNQPTLMIYGATGYTGQLVTAEAMEVGLRPVLAGRNPAKLASVADPCALETRAVALEDADRLVETLKDVAVVVHCAGPFWRTALPMFEACLKSGTHYLDITGEIPVFEALAARDADAREAGIMVLPGAGFDVVPSDCLVADLAARHPGGQCLRLAMALHGGTSRGTARTILDHLDSFLIRREGEITQVAAGSLRHEFDFGEPPDVALNAVWGDVSTAYRSTGIANVETYVQVNPKFRNLVRVSRLMNILPARGVLRRLLGLLVDRAPSGPSEAERRASYTIMVAEIEGADGERVAARLRVPDPYGFTAKTAVAIASRALQGDVKIGYQTPALAYGADFIRQFEGVQRDYSIKAFRKSAV